MVVPEHGIPWLICASELSSFRSLDSTSDKGSVLTSMALLKSVPLFFLSDKPSYLSNDDSNDNRADSGSCLSSVCVEQLIHICS